MIDNGRKTIGVFIAQIEVEYQEILSRGIASRAKELDYNVIFFTSFGGYGQAGYDYGEGLILEIPSYRDLDAVIIAVDTYAVKGMQDTLLNHVRELCKDIPIISVRREYDDFYNVLIDDYTVIEEIIHHFIEVHGFTKLNFLAGPKGFPDSEKRLESYKRVLKEHNLPYEEERVYYGDFWRNKAFDAVEHWLSSDETWPEAIICANDYMAISTSNALSQWGIKVPEQIAVSGCDDLTEASEYTPSITTARMPTFEMGMEAVDKVYRLHQGIQEKKDSLLRTISIYRDSCGCKTGVSNEVYQWTRYYIKKYSELQKAVSQNGYMSGDLSGLTTLDEINSRLRFYVYDFDGFKDFYLCLFPDWMDYSGEDKKRNVIERKQMLMEVGIKNRTDYSRIMFEGKKLFPQEFADDEPMIFFVGMLHHQATGFGYVAIRFDHIKTYGETFQAWMISVGNALEGVRIHSELNRLVNKLEDMYVRDDLTGIYNRRGMTILGENYLKRAKEDKVNLMVLMLDLDKLKMINDNFGHRSGDIAIKTIASALQEAAKDDEICIRAGGDEFSVIGFDYNIERAEDFLGRFLEALDRSRLCGLFEFELSVSHGWCIMIPEEETTLEDYMVIADELMYRMKNERRAAE